MFVSVSELSCLNGSGFAEKLEKEWLQYWNENSEQLVWKAWVEKYPDNVDPDYQQTPGVVDTSCKTNYNDSVYTDAGKEVECERLPNVDSGYLENGVSEANCRTKEREEGLTEFCPQEVVTEVVDVLQQEPAEDYSDLWARLWEEHYSEMYSQLHEEFMQKFIKGFTHDILVNGLCSNMVSSNELNNYETENPIVTTDPGETLAGEGLGENHTIVTDIGETLAAEGLGEHGEPEDGQADKKKSSSKNGTCMSLSRIQWNLCIILPLGVISSIMVVS